jgi:hypothetical protein
MTIKRPFNHPGKYVLLDFDNDTQGQEYTQEAQRLLAEVAQIHGKELWVRLPTRYKEGNDQLVGQQAGVTCI